MIELIMNKAELVRNQIERTMDRPDSDTRAKSKEHQGIPMKNIRGQRDNVETQSHAVYRNKYEELADNKE